MQRKALPDTFQDTMDRHISPSSPLCPGEVGLKRGPHANVQNKPQSKTRPQTPTREIPMSP